MGAIKEQFVAIIGYFRGSVMQIAQHEVCYAAVIEQRLSILKFAAAVHLRLQDTTFLMVCDGLCFDLQC